MDEEQEDVAQVREWIGRLEQFIASLAGTDGDDPFDFCENAMDAWKDGVSPDTAPPPTSPAMLIILETFRALAQVMTSATVDYYTTPDVRDRITRDAAQGSLTDALDGVGRDAERWLTEGLPSAEEVQQRTADVGASMKAALEVNAKMLADQDADDAAAAADPYGAILGYRDPMWMQPSSSRRCVRSPKTRMSVIAMPTTGFGECWIVNCCATFQMRATGSVMC